MSIRRSSSTTVRSAVSCSISHNPKIASALSFVSTADVFLTNIRMSALAGLGLDADTLLARNERLVYALITGFGMNGPDAVRPAYDIAAYWARSGLAAALTPAGAPLPFQRGGMGDHSVAMTAAGMVGATLLARERTGKGQLVSTSLLRQRAYTIGFDVNVALMWVDPSWSDSANRWATRRSTTTRQATVDASGSSDWRATVIGRRSPVLSADRSGSTTRASQQHERGSNTHGS